MTDQIKCSGCRVLQDASEYIDENGNQKTRCKKCVRRYLNRPKKTNSFWDVWSELAPIFSDEFKSKHSRLTVASGHEIQFNCPACEGIFMRSPANLGIDATCPHCRKFLIDHVSGDQLFNETVRLIRAAADYDDYERKLLAAGFSPIQLGMIQEIFAKIYFQVHAKLYDISEYISYSLSPPAVIHKLSLLGLPNSDLGTDAVAVHPDGSVSLIQIKWRSRKVCHTRSVFHGLTIDALGAKCAVRNLVLFSNSSQVAKTLPTGEKFRYILYDTIREINWGFFMQNLPTGRNTAVGTRTITINLRDWQREAIQFTVEQLREKQACTIIAPCGAGKSYYALEALRALKKEGYLALVIVPTLQLLGQWYTALAVAEQAEYLLVGSQFDPSDVLDVPYRLTTNVKEICKALEKRGDKMIVIATYYSLESVFEACNKRLIAMDITFADEAHLTTGDSEKTFGLICREDFPTENKVYMTATPKILKGNLTERLVSMDDPLYGERFTYSCRQAIDDGILCDYNVILGLVDQLEDGFPDSQRYDLYTRFLLHVIKNYELKRVLIASNNHNASAKFYNAFSKVAAQNGLEHALVHMPPSATSRDKNAAIAVISQKPAIVFNVRVFNLGTDIPNLDAVFFNGDKSSTIDIVQTAMRCLRTCAGKELAYIIVPAFSGGAEEMNVENKGDYPLVRNTLHALGWQDSAIQEELIVRSKNAMTGAGGGGGSRIKFVNMAEEVDVESLEMETRFFDRFGRSKDVSPNIKYEILKREIKKIRKWLPDDAVIDGLCIGSFQDNLKSAICGHSKSYKSFVDEWIKDLKQLDFWPILEKSMGKRLGLVETKTPSKLFKWLLTELPKKRKWLTKGDTKDKKPLEHFQKNLKNALCGDTRYYKTDIEVWRTELKKFDFWPILKKDLDKMIEKRSKEKLTFPQKFARLLPILKKTKSWIPKRSIEYHYLLCFQNSLKKCLKGTSKQFDQYIEKWLKQLKKLDCWDILEKDLIVKEKIQRQQLSPKQKFSILLKLIKKNKGWIAGSVVVDGVLIGVFQSAVKGLMIGRIDYFKNYAEEWLTELKKLPYWPEMEQQVINNKKV